MRDTGGVGGRPGNGGRGVTYLRLPTRIVVSPMRQLVRGGRTSKMSNSLLDICAHLISMLRAHPLVPTLRVGMQPWSRKPPGPIRDAGASALAPTLERGSQRWRCE